MEDDMILEAGESPFPEDDPMHEATEDVGHEVNELQRALITLQRMMDAENAAELIEDEKRGALGQSVVRDYKIDRDSRREWEDQAKRALDIAKQVKTAKNHPWANASNVKYPLLTTAALQFAARAYPAIVDGPRIVKCIVQGADPESIKAGQADRVSQHMSYQLLYEVPGWESDVDTALHQIPIVGCAFKKVYADDTQEAGFCDDLVSAIDFVVNQKTKDLKSVPRWTHVYPLYPHEIRERQRDGRFLDVELTRGGDDTDTTEDDDAPHTFLEQMRYWDADGDEFPEPWIVTVHESTQRVVRCVPCFTMEDVTVNQMKAEIARIKRREYWVKIPFIPDPEGGFYDIGFGKLLEPISEVIDTTINQMLDAATLQNAGGGLIGGQLGLGKGNSKVTVSPGVYKTVTTAGDDIRRAIYNWEHPGPSPVLFNLLDFLLSAGKDVAAIQDILQGDTAGKSTMTATTTMALIEQGLKVFTAIYKRIYRALKDEYRLIFEINRANPNLMGKYVALLDEPVQVSQGDYMGRFDIVPTSDPNMVTDMQRMARAQLVLEEAKSGNPVVNIEAATRRAFEAARIERIDEVIQPQQPDPMAVKAAEVEVENKQSDTFKKVADGVKTLAEVGIPAGVPLAVADPEFVDAPPMTQPMPDMGMGPPDMGQTMPGPDELGFDAAMLNGQATPSLMPDVPPEAMPPA